MQELNETEKIIEEIMDKEKLGTQAQVADFLGIAASTLHGLIARNSTKTIKKHLRFKNINFENSKIQNESEVELWLEVLKREYKLTNYIMLGEFLDVAPSAITRWTQSKDDEALKLLQKHLIKREVNLNVFESRVEEFKKSRTGYQKTNDFTIQSSTDFLYSPLFQKIIAKKEKELWSLLADEIENATEEEKLEFFEDFETLIEATVTPQARLALFNEQYSQEKEILKASLLKK